MFIIIVCILYFVSYVLSGVYNCIFVCAAIWHNKERISNSSRPSISVSITGLLRETKVLVLVLILATKVLVLVLVLDTKVLVLVLVLVTKVLVLVLVLAL